MDLSSGKGGETLSTEIDICVVVIFLLELGEPLSIKHLLCADEDGTLIFTPHSFLLVISRGLGHFLPSGESGKTHRGQLNGPMWWVHSKFWNGDLNTQLLLLGS